MITETAYAKINLALHVRSKREDGYHEIETLFAFVDAGDVLVARAAEADRLETVGEFADVLDNPFDNLVARTMSTLPREGGLHVTLEKNLPVAAGLGGGSADAGAMFRIIEQMHGLPDDWEEKAIRLGADVPACVASEMAIGRGTGTDLEPVENDMAGMAVLLVNLRVPLPTGPVFKAWADTAGGEDLGPLPTGTAREIARKGRNDLRPPAVAICPPIADVLQALEATDPWMCEMSGSGATCFALYDETEMRDKAARAIAEHHPGWWQMTGTLQ
ncbi:4-(cytidine 5'-diphospho)-2-C-methyl-D-erythritol kinase [Erythrobacter litoralis]|uniref:4-diphosphocytidyl-2-C-methyl-D-erythritol kinase n=1 Tax=Erythrobacter litoralis (strain HTCC2594) TaxID=314225 RepID=ISPE_ERYLH|nr:4-(cytidine 5'-diphospho)-2-C-methyl-D-erythritol kinase [Erythrobacter litoralis]Q2NA15.1 RecName: Full=4-diphosphocytidyl-2-C-methyl-D-erythritol kinase; Short=CMK; AltName: Full=4-(cytidine-5'-diphospho)-2-C-methyl-D-erythritol kinase [Erythrobacter litoralis HTCC2594]ABC63476.1 4-diphosphocytidyl-2-C-methyl-D-erythritol kinase [Erythrobacter litoralis HTCC2594]